MPQLRDSGTRALHATEPVPSAEMDGFCRIFGVETEYGVAVTGAEKPVDAGQVAMTMFQPIVSRSRSTNTYLTNGSRLYLDVGSHPEYATAEARDPREALAQDLAGEQVMRGLALKAQTKLRESYGAHATIHVFKNNVDSAGHAFGCHENYLVRRFVPLEAVEHQLLPFLITRQLYTGAGRMTPDGFQITQRADFLDEAVSSATTRSRPMVNTRDEPHADPDSFRRLHVIIGDSNRSQWSTWMKLAVTHLVLCVIEEAFRRGEPSGFEDWAFVDPAAANRAVSRFLDAPDAVLPLASGESVSALALQRRYFRAVESFVADHREAMDAAFAAGVPATGLSEKTVETTGEGLSGMTAGAGLASDYSAGSLTTVILGEWDRALRALEQGDYDALADRVDWAAKRRVFEALRRRRPEVTFAQLEQLELDYHDIANGRLYGSLTARSQMRRLLTADETERAIHEAPQDTRAALRGRFVEAALASGAQFSADWTHLTVTAPERREAVLLDPFEAAPTPEFSQLMESLGR
ncbi:proteasome accessory factor PafA2 family protein [Bifidobacterium miconisargentati]|uniref:proteasome accessory factor PafA2 family protein n=1 Tax=Bifidobacterium miconisargentati TaxID=2834437 RepID=UPI001BDC0BFD|nr:proteasome accessory factor PafA2 family protein [Bifidobacterium miconisargentati]MBW3089476.1 proteasome accessory factor PafA2 family protein [Bifidobacterium miconisargentati]